jgi:FAD/FMN-containing dehydrogenase
LSRTLDGDLLTPDSTGYDVARRPPIPLFHGVRPAAVLRPRSEADIAAALGFACDAGLPIVVRSGGHSFAGLSSTEGLLVDLSAMDSVAFSDDVVMIGAGARLGRVYDALHQHEMTLAAGCGPSVGIAGLTIGGGLGILGRAHGLTCDQLVAARVVLPDGSVVECDEGREPDLFWALRGGGSPGVVTRLDLRTLPEPEATTFHLTWPWAATAALVATWQAWAPDGPDELAASLLVTAGPDPGRPPTPHVFGAMLGAGSRTRSLLADLVTRVGFAPASRSSRTTSYRRVKEALVEIGDRFGAEAHGPDAERRHGYHKSEFFDRPLPQGPVEAVTELLARRPAGVGAELDLMPWGGAYNRVAPESTAFVHRTERFLVRYAVSVDPAATDDHRTAARDWLHRAWGTLHPYGTGRAYQNFPDPTLEDEQHAYFGDNLDRLVGVRVAYDPDGLLTGP